MRKLEADGISITYGDSPNSGIKVNFDGNDLNYPLSLYFSQGANVIWSHKVMGHGTWAAHPNPGNVDIKIVDSVGDLIFNKPYEYGEGNITTHTEEIEFIRWCENFIEKNSYRPRGIAIGCNDGNYGEWVTASEMNLIGKTILIEPNPTPFTSLVYRYQKDPRFSFKNCVVSKENGIVKFYTNPEGNSGASSLLENHVTHHGLEAVEKEVISVNPNDMLKEFECDWIHMDVEGMDSDIICLIDNENLENIGLIMWENIHLSNSQKSDVESKLKSIGFEIFHGSGYNSIATKNR